MIRNRHTKWIAGAALALALGAGLLATNSAYAQTPGTTDTPSTTPQATTPDNSTAPLEPFGGRGPGGPGGHGGGRGGPGGPGDFGGPGGAATADGATRAISSTEQLITLVKSDLAYATGKMDTTSVSGWLADADSYLAQAKTAQAASQYGQAVGYAQAARELAQTADLAMAQALGSANLPSYSSNQGRPHGPADQSQTPTQAQVSRELAGLYNAITSQGALVSSNAEAAKYLDQAEAAYKTAYDAYQAGNYQAAANSGKIARELLEVSQSLLRAAGAPANADSPVTVPAPNF